MIMHSGDKRDRVRIPLSNFNRHPLYSKMGDDYFNKFVINECRNWDNESYANFYDSF